MLGVALGVVLASSLKHVWFVCLRWLDTFRSGFCGRTHVFNMFEFSVFQPESWSKLGRRRGRRPQDRQEALLVFALLARSKFYNFVDTLVVAGVVLGKCSCGVLPLLQDFKRVSCSMLRQFFVLPNYRILGKLAHARTRAQFWGSRAPPLQNVDRKRNRFPGDVEGPRGNAWVD